jgi:hypothetical protein
MSEKTGKSESTTTEHMIESAETDKQPNILGAIGRATPSNMERQQWLATLYEMAGYVSPASVKSVPTKRGCTVIMTITPSRCKLDGSALPVTTSGMPSMAKD